MNFHIKLSQLMEQFRVSNSKLAKEINVDPSLISRWRSGMRVPSLRSPHLPAIATYFISINGYSYQQDFLRKIVENHKLYVPNLNDPVAILADWLVNEQESTFSNRNPNITQAHAVNFIEQIKTMVEEKSEPDRPQTSISLDSFIPLKTQQKREYFNFVGNKGKREAVLNILQYINSLVEITDIYLTSEEDMSWLTEDRHFQIQWANYLKEIILKGHQIFIIHMVQRESTEILSALTLWIPLHLLGSIKSYYNPRYQTSIVKNTWFLVKDQLALVSASSQFTAPNYNCQIFTDREIVNTYETLFFGKLAECKPLVEAFRVKDQSNLLSVLIQNTAVIAPTTSIHSNLNSLFLPDSVFYRYSKSLPESQQKQYIDSIRQWRTRIFQSFSIAPYIDIFPIDVLRQISNDKKYDHYDSTFFGIHEISCSSQEIKEIIENMIYVINHYDPFQLYFLHNIQKKSNVDINITLKENTDAFFTTSHQSKIPFLGLLIHEGNILNSLNYYVEDLINQIPNSRRNKNETLKELQALLKKL